MAIPVLLLAAASPRLASARMPWALARAGFEPALLAPPGSLAEQSAFVSKVGHLPESKDLAQWVFPFAAIVKATSPRLVIPCDGRALRFLYMLVLTPPGGLEPTLQSQLAALIRESLGDPAHYRDNLDETLLPAAAESVGVPVPPYAICAEPGEANAFASRRGFPVTMKGDERSRGQELAICADSGQLSDSFDEFKRAGAERVLVQAHVAGPTELYPSVAWNGALLVGYAQKRLVVDPPPTGAPVVNRCYASPGLRALAEKLAAGFGINGFFAPEFVEDARTKQPYLLGINRRLVIGAHRGGAINADHWAALAAALQGLAPPTRSDLDIGEEHVAVDFPQEWLRDPQSRWLSEYPVDVPWEEPRLLEAMLALRRER